jgi:hypothetical protein
VTKNLIYEIKHSSRGILLIDLHKSRNTGFKTEVNFFLAVFKIMQIMVINIIET